MSIASVVLLGFSHPTVLLAISAVVGGFMTVLYSGLLILVTHGRGHGRQEHQRPRRGK